MKAYTFRLEPVLRVRRQAEERARAEALVAATAAGQQAAALTAADQAYATCSTPPGRASTAQFLAGQAHRAGLAAVLVAQRSRVERADEVVAQTRAAWSATAVRVSALERLDERRRTEHRLAVSRAEATALDDLVVSRPGISRHTSSCGKDDR